MSAPLEVALPPPLAPVQGAGDTSGSQAQNLAAQVAASKGNGKFTMFMPLMFI